MNGAASQATPRILIMAAGTGGHVFPALAVARRLQARGVEVEWLASERGMENSLLKDSGIRLHPVAVTGLRGKGPLRLLTAPWMLLRALSACLRLLRRLRPVAVLGMGGYISGPGGVAACLLRIPLVLHEQNAVPGFTNRALRRYATLILETFPGSFSGGGKSARGEGKIVHTGIPLRQEISRLHGSLQRDYPDPLTSPGLTAHDFTSGQISGENGEPPKHARTADCLHLLVLGGSLGAGALNEAVPAALGQWRQDECPLSVWHQTGAKTHAETLRRYTDYELTDKARYRIDPFIDDMAAAYTWADLVLCRAGASTVNELAAARLPAVLVPYPHHRDRQQLHNARWLCAAGAARLLEQSRLTAAALGRCLLELSRNRGLLRTMSERAGDLALLGADERIADCCLEVARG